MADRVDRAAIAEAQRSGATRTPIPQSLVARALTGIRYVITGAGPEAWFGPSQPLAPMAPAEVAGRQFDYPSGVNLTTTPRVEERVSFAQLRALADGYDILRTIIETRKDQIERLQWTIRRRSLPNGEPVARDDDPRIAAIEAFFRMPDRVNFWSTWLRQLLEDLFVVDAPSLLIRRNRGGALHALEIIDGTTIKRLINADGRTPAPPDPAYQQVLHGLPAADFTTDELIYRPRNPRAHKLYGYSPVEQVVMTVNIALRRQLYQLSYFTEGNVPEALIGTPEAWSPAQIKEFQQYWDALLEGNLGQRRHAKFVPGGVAKTFIPTKEVELKSAYDEWLARVICFAFSISPQAFTDHMNRATAETAHDTALAEGLAPLQNWIKQLVDYVIITEFAAPDLEFQWRDDRETDPQQAAGIAQIYVTNGIKTINEVRSDIGLDPVPGGDTPMVFTGTGPVPLTQIGAGGLGKAYNPDEPRNPGGEGRNSGEWTSGGGSDSTSSTDAGPKDDGTGDTTGSRGSGRGRETQVASNDDGTRSDAGSLPAPSGDDGTRNDRTLTSDSATGTDSPKPPPDPNDPNAPKLSDGSSPTRDYPKPPGDGPVRYYPPDQAAKLPPPPSGTKYLTLNDGSVVWYQGANHEQGGPLLWPADKSLADDVKDGRDLKADFDDGLRGNEWRQMKDWYEKNGSKDYQHTYGVDGNINRDYVDSTNYGYGATAAAAGYSLDDALYWAGVANMGEHFPTYIDNSSDPMFSGPHGNKPRNADMIIAGYNDYKAGKISPPK